MKSIQYLKNTILLMSAAISYVLTFAGDIQPVVKAIGISNGLSNDYILDIMEDGNNNIWIATDAGLNRFDGRDFIQFTTRNCPFTSNSINRLFYDQCTDNLWIATKIGTYVLDCATLQITDAKDIIKCDSDYLIYNVMDIKRASDGGIWLLNRYDDIVHFDPATSHAYVINRNTNPQLPTSFWSMEDDGNGNILLATDGDGLAVMNTSNNHVKVLRNKEDDETSIPDNIVKCVTKDSTGQIWIGTSTGLANYNMDNDTFTSHKDFGHKAHSITESHIYTIKEMSDGEIWLGADVGGVSKIHKSYDGDFEIVNLPISIERFDGGIASKYVRVLFQDSFGNIWIGHYGQGVDFISHYQQIFFQLDLTQANGLDKIRHKPNSLMSDSDGSLWIGGDGELMHVKNGKLLNVYKVPSKSDTEEYPVSPLAKIGDHILVSVYEDGLYMYSPALARSEKIEGPRKRMQFISYCKLPNGEEYVGSYNGIYKLENNKIIPIPGLPHQIEDLPITSIITDKDNRIWISTYGDGVFVFDRGFNNFHHININESLLSNGVKHLYCDSRGWIWIGAQEGLSCVTEPSKLSGIRNYSYDEGLEDISIRAISEDLWGNIWVSTNRGLSRWNKETGKIENFDHNQRVPRGSFMDRGVTIDNSGKLYFCSVNGISYFDPKNIDDDIPVSQIKITELRTLGDSEHEGMYVKYNKDGDRIIYTFPYDENSFTIQFSVRDCSQSDNVEYAYQMKGIDNEWVYLKGDNKVTFRNLPSGEYTFNVRAKLKNKDWEEYTETAVAINIVPPIWLRWWAKLLYIIAFLAVVYLFFKYHTKRQELKNTLEFERRNAAREKELNEERLRFFTNITHELRTPLTLIMGPLEDLTIDKDLAPQYKAKVSMIRHSSIRLLNLINQILEFRKTETQNKELTIVHSNIANLVMETGLRFKELNNSSDVEMSISVDKTIGKIYYDPDAITTVINNLLSNAFKYTPAGEIDLSLTQTERDGIKWVSLVVSDNGYGITPEALPHIFDRYYQAKGKHQASGTGIGLALVKSLVDLHQGTIKVESTPGKGTKFTFEILMNNTYPNAIHKNANTENDSDEYTDFISSDGIEDMRPMVLVVEDNSDIRRYIYDALSSKYRVQTAANGKEGLTKATSLIPDIIISDVMMPEMDGIEMCKKVKENISTSHIPVILLTAKDSIQDKEAGYESGADSYITKPFSASLLESRIHNLFESRSRLSKLLTSSMSPIKPMDTEEEVMAEAEDKSIQPLPLSKLDQEFLNKLNSLLDEHISDDTLNISFFEDKMNMSASTFYRKVKALTGMSGNEYIRMFRIRHSAKLLSEGMSVSEAAYNSGFNDLVYFRKCFKAEFGVVPSKFDNTNISK